MGSYERFHLQMGLQKKKEKIEVSELKLRKGTKRCGCGVTEFSDGGSLSLIFVSKVPSN